MAGKTILIIEDEATLLEYLSKALERAGFRVLKSSTAAEGLEIAQEEKPDILLLDILLPGGGGEEVLKQLKSAEETKSIKVVALTNLSDPDLRERCLQMGCVDFWVKADYRLDQIVEKVKGLL